VSAANGGIAPGAVIGGVSIAAWGAGDVGYISAAIAVLAAVAVPLIGKLASAASRQAR
jgi:predicted MFS family arabinose efflux permease